ncbi:hypothetical protein OAG30_00540 [Flavobacteriaceae bacterium]|nr:hypothetical protein [Flavobacteriaceae bacterium]
MIELFLILLVSGILRFLFSIIPISDVTDDSYYHRYMIKMQEGKFTPNFIYTKAIEKVSTGYPRLQHFFLSRFPEKLWPFLGNILIIFYDLFHILLFYFLARELALNFFIEDKIKSSILFTPWGYSAFLFGTTPLLFPFLAARLTGISNARTLGNLFTFILYVLWYHIDIKFQFQLLPVALFFVFLIINTSQFAFQNYSLSFLFYSILSGSIITFIFFIGSIIFSLAIPSTRNIIYYKIQHWKWYFKNGEIIGRNKLSELIKMPFYLIKDPLKFFEYFFVKFTPFIVIYSIPGIFLLWSHALEPNEPLLYCINLLLSSTVIFVITSLKPFLFLGESERYFEYTLTCFYLILMGLFLTDSLQELNLLALIFIHIVTVLFIFISKNYTHLSFIKLGKSSTSPELKALLNFLKPIEKVNLLTYPIKLSVFLAYHTFEMDNVLLYQRMMNPKNGFRSYFEDTISIEKPINNLSRLKKKYGLTHFLFLKSDNRFNFDLFEEYKLDKADIVYEDKEYVLFILNDL